MEQTFTCYASAAFGLEGLVAAELREFGISGVRAENGGVRFTASPEELFLCNLKLHFCDRVFIVAAEGVCTSFKDLFQLVLAVPWQDYAEGREAFLVSAKCARSKLMSPRDCQSVTKKAIIEKLKAVRNQNVFPEDGAPLPVQVSVHSDVVRICINTSGEALSRRGYRTWNGEAPLRETLAAALVRLSSWDGRLPLADPCCGTGTILVEAAFMASGRAPGLTRSFAMEKFAFFRSLPFASVRSRVAGEWNREAPLSVQGSDIDPEAVDLALRHIRQADVSGMVRVVILPLQELQLPDPEGVFICNPPYGERLSDQKSCRLLYRDLRSLKERHPGWRMCVISSDPAFERSFGKRADKKRRLYNGRLECTYYIYN
ncbi:MAG: class I SAM-dependent RNA methyltransferase [Clostridia bacterium]|nr:class I SAM-dependent RNA methyltransferase [Clostridia bacterium]